MHPFLLPSYLKSRMLSCHMGVLSLYWFPESPLGIQSPAVLAVCVQTTKMSPVQRCYAVPVPPEKGLRQKALFESTTLSQHSIEENMANWDQQTVSWAVVLLYTSVFRKKSHSDVEKFWFSSTNINFSFLLFPSYTLSYFSNCATFNGSYYYLFHRIS